MNKIDRKKLQVLGTKLGIYLKENETQEEFLKRCLIDANKIGYFDLKYAGISFAEFEKSLNEIDFKLDLNYNKYKKISHRKAMKILSETKEQLFVKIDNEYVSFTLDYDWEIELGKDIDCKKLESEEDWRGEVRYIDFLELYRYDIYKLD